MRVLHIISSGGMYGAESVILNISRMLNEHSHHAEVAVFSNSQNPNVQLHENALKEGIESHLIACDGQVDLSVTESLRNLAFLAKPGVVHSHGYKADVYAYLAFKGMSMPLVSTCHGWLNHGVRNHVYGALDRRILRRYGAVVAVSDQVRSQLLRSGVQEEKIRIIENGIDLRPFENALPSIRSYAIESDGLLVGIVGRLSKEKGVDIFVEAAARVLKELPSARFVVVGDGPERGHLVRMISSLNIDKEISLLGRRDDMASIYASLDLMVSSSRQEGLPMTLLEGMASRLPVLATTVGSVPDVIADGHSGVLVAPENVQLLAEKMLDLLRSPARRQMLGNAARDAVEKKFSAERMMRDYVCIYENAIGQASKNHRIS